MRSFLCLSILAVAEIPASASTTIPEITTTRNAVATESGWQFRASLYGWATALDGDVTIRGIDVPVDVAFEDVFDKLDFAVMGAVGFEYGRWNFIADFFFAELGASNSGRKLDFEAQLEQFIGNFVIAYNVIEDFETCLDVYAGARVNSMEVDVDITRTGILGPRTFSASDSKSWVDPILGVRLQRELSSCFFLRAVGDIGGFGVSSDVTWQALLGLGYHINDSASVMIGYRSLGTDYEDGNFGYDVVSHGLLLGLEYRF